MTLDRPGFKARNFGFVNNLVSLEIFSIAYLTKYANFKIYANSGFARYMIFLI